MFLDEAEVTFKSGRGGSGAVSFHREKHVPRGGPNGADGGKGGDIILIADRGKRTLYDFKLHDKFEAQNGVHGLGNKRGKDGRSIEIKVPVGTIIRDLDLDEPLVDLNLHGMKFVIARGGRGGYGNQHYTSSVRQAPNFAQKGAPEEIVRAKLELKLLADVGLVGLPNAGKSTLISAISAARPKIADYPFTTIVPNLGVVKYHDDSFVVADMPGLIEGASGGTGLGHQFLKHVERNRLLVHVVEALPPDGSDPVANFELIERELKLYSEEIWKRPRIIALSKIDVVPSEDFNEIRERFEATGLPLFPISAVTGQGLEPLLFQMHATLQEALKEPEIPVLIPAMARDEDLAWDVVAVEDGFEVQGKRVRRLVAMTDLENADAVRYLHRRLQRLGVIDRLREMGAEEGDTVYVGEAVFGFTDSL
jgi:GTP-binding protein